jgi:hypothetical protein
MQMLHCPNCGKLSGFKRALGFGTFFMVLLTFGLWLLVIPFYPARCINCGLTRGSAVSHNFSVWFRGLSRGSKALVVLTPLAFLFILALFNAFRRPSQQSEQIQGDAAPAVQAHDISTAPAAAQDSAPGQVNDGPEDHELRLVPNLLGRGAASDGRTYSVALISANKEKVPPATTLFVQGTILGQFDTNVIVLADEQETSQKILCAMSADEAEDVAHYYHIGEPVQITGSFGVINLGLPILRDCEVASPTDKVVRPLPAAPTAPTSPEEQNQNPAISNASDSQAAQISEGQTQEQVTAVLGPPISVTTGAQHIYTYPHLTIVFLDGKVSEIHREEAVQ